MLEDFDQKPVTLSRCVVRLRTTAWADKSGLHLKKSFVFLRRRCEGFNLMEEDSGAIGASEVIARIANLGACADGIYEVVPCNEVYDRETGILDEYSYLLRPVSEAVELNKNPA